MKVEQQQESLDSSSSQKQFFIASQPLGLSACFLCRQVKKKLFDQCCDFTP
jgi:hypothetical protein